MYTNNLSRNFTYFIRSSIEKKQYTIYRQCILWYKNWFLMGFVYPLAEHSNRLSLPSKRSCLSLGLTCAFTVCQTIVSVLILLSGQSIDSGWYGTLYHPDSKEQRPSELINRRSELGVYKRERPTSSC